MWWRRGPIGWDWAIEKWVHHARRVSMGEVAHQMQSGNARQALAALRNTLLTLLRWAAWTTIAAVRHFAGAPREALQVIGAAADSGGALVSR